MSTELRELVPMLISGDVPRAIEFYRGVLGFEVVDELADVGKSGWVSLRKGKVGLMLASPTYLPKTPTIDGKHNQVIFYFYPEDVVALRDSIVAKGYSAGELHVTFYNMKEFELTDQDGHCLVFGQQTDEEPTPIEEGKP